MPHVITPATAQHACKSLRRHRMAAKLLAVGMCAARLRKQRLSVRVTQLFATGLFPLLLARRRRLMLAHKVLALGLVMRAYRVRKDEKRKEWLQHCQQLLAPDASAGRLRGVGWSAIPSAAGLFARECNSLCLHTTLTACAAYSCCCRYCCDRRCCHFGCCCRGCCRGCRGCCHCRRGRRGRCCCCRCCRSELVGVAADSRCRPQSWHTRVH